MTTPTVTKRIVYNPQDHDYACWIVFEDGHEECIGDKPTFHDAELECGNYILNFYQDNDTPEAAARLIMEELAQEGRHEQAATGMGGVWREPRIDPEVSPSDYMDVTPAYTCDVCGETKPEESFDYQDSDAIVCRSCTPIAPPPCPNCEGRGVVLDDKGHYRVCLCRHGKGYALGGDAAVQPPTYPPCPCGGPADHHPQRCNVIGQLLMPGPLPALDPHWCPSCGDAWARPGLCAACRETGEGVNWSEQAISLPLQSWVV